MLLILFNGKYPFGMAMSNRLHFYAKGLNENGISVLVVAKSEGQSSRLQYHEGVASYGIRAPLPASNILFRQVNLYLSNVLFLVQIVRRISSARVVWLIDFGLTMNFVMVFLCRAFGKKVIFEVNENPHTTAGSRISSGRITKIQRWLTLHWLFPLVHGFVVISEALNMLVSKSAPKSKVIKIPILADPEHAEVASTNSVAEYKPFIFHAGTLTQKKDGILTVFEAFAKVNKVVSNRLNFVLTNRNASPDVLAKIDTLVSEHQLEARVHFTGHLQPEQLAAFLNGASMAVVNKPVNDQNLYNFSTKLTDYLRFKLPVIISNVGEATNFLTDNQSAFIVEPDNAEHLAKTMEYILKNEVIAKGVGEGGYEILRRHFDYRTHAPALANFVRTL